MLFQSETRPITNLLLQLIFPEESIFECTLFYYHMVQPTIDIIRVNIKIMNTSVAKCSSIF